MLKLQDQVAEILQLSFVVRDGVPFFNGMTLLRGLPDLGTSKFKIGPRISTLAFESLNSMWG